MFDRLVLKIKKLFKQDKIKYENFNKYMSKEDFDYLMKHK